MCDDFVIKNQQQKYKKGGRTRIVHVYYNCTSYVLYMKFLDPNTD